MAKRSTKERRRGKRRENRHERAQAIHAGGGDWDAITVPDGLEVFRPEANETYHMDIIPYVVGGYNKAADPGDEYYEFSYPVYNGLGVEDKRYVAIGELLGQRDPVAEHFARMRKSGADWDDFKAFKPTWRQLMLVFVHEQADKGLQLWEGAYGTFGELLAEEIRANEEDYIDNFDDPEGGATLVVRFKAKNIGKSKPWVLASKINFEEREDGFTAGGDRGLAAKVLDQAAEICLDDCLKVADYETLEKALNGEPLQGSSNDAPDGNKHVGKQGRKEGRRGAVRGEPDEGEEPDGGEEPDPKPKTTKRKQPTAEDLGITKGAEVEHDEFGTCTVMRVAKDGLTITLLDEDDNVHKGVDITDVEPLEGNAGGGDAPPADKKPTTKKRVGGMASAKSAGSSARSRSGPKAAAKDVDPNDEWDANWGDD